MTKDELSEAMKVAKDKTVDLSAVDLMPFDGCGLRGFQPIATTIRAVARLIRWQCFMLNGEIDVEELSEIARIGRTKFQIVG